MIARKLKFNYIFLKIKNLLLINQDESNDLFQI